MPSRYAKYNPEILAVECPFSKCKAKVYDRCKGSISGGSWTPPHMLRVQAAGLTWNEKTREYSKIGDQR